MRKTQASTIFYASAFIAAVVALLTILFGYVYNLIWLFTASAEATGQFIIAIVGAIIPLLGAIHGLYVFSM